MMQWLQQQAAAGRVIGGLSNGAFLLAKAGLLDGFAATEHWENFVSFFHLYPNTLSRYQRFAIDRNRMTCSGGSSTLDLFIEMVRNDLGHELAQQVSRQMLLQDYSMPSPTETLLVLDGNYHFSARVQRALSLLDTEVSQRVNVSGLAERVGISRRELLRLFRREIGKTPGEVLNQRQLERSKSLVLHSHLSLVQISSAVGFSSPSHMTTCYRKLYNITPAQHRRQH